VIYAQLTFQVRAEVWSSFVSNRDNIAPEFQPSVQPAARVRLIAAMEYGYAVAQLGLFHEMRRERNRRSGFLELFEVRQISRRDDRVKPVAAHRD